MRLSISWLAARCRTCERSVRFYTGALGLTRGAAAADVRHARRVAGGRRRSSCTWSARREPGRTARDEPAVGPGRGRDRLREPPGVRRSTISTRRSSGPVEHGVEPPPARSFARGDGVRRTFVTDPDGHVIELMETGVAGDRFGRADALHGRRGVGPPACEEPRAARLELTASVTELFAEVAADARRRTRGLWARRAVIGASSPRSRRSRCGALIGQRDSESTAREAAA